MGDDHILTNKFAEIFHIISRELSKMGNYFQGKPGSGYTSLALTIATVIIYDEIAVDEMDK